MGMFDWLFGSKQQPEDKKTEPTKDISDKQENIKTIKVDFDKLQNSPYMSAYDFDWYLDADEHYIKYGNRILDVPVDIYNAAQAYIEKEEKEKRQWNDYSSKVNAALAKEKEGDLLSAIEFYKSSFEYCHSIVNGIYPYERVVILYRKLKDYENEKAVILELLQFVKGEWKEQYEKRLEKVNKLIAKQNER